MSWFKVDDKAAFNAKVLKAGNECFGALVRMGCWSSDHLTDGRIPIETAALIANDKVLRRLKDVGFLKPNGDDFIIHDFLEYNPSSLDVKAKRESEAAKKGRWRDAKRTRVSTVDTPKLSTVDKKETHEDVPALSTSSRSRPDPTRSEQKKIAPGRPAPPPLPFRADVAIKALADASSGRFVVSKMTKGQAINTEKTIREAPDLDLWTLVGQWLAAGGDAWRGILDIRSLRDFLTWLAHAQAWSASGRGPIRVASVPKYHGPRPPVAALVVGGKEEL